MSDNVTRLKASVTLDGLQPAGIRILATVDNAAKLFHLDQTITCGTDSHPPTDPHTKGNALDVRVTNFSAQTILRLYGYFVQTLGTSFTVLYECPARPEDPDLQTIAYVNPHATAPHFHIQLARRATAWPPAVLA